MGSFGGLTQPSLEGIELLLQGIELLLLLDDMALQHQQMVPDLTWGLMPHGLGKGKGPGCVGRCTSRHDGSHSSV